MNINDWKLSRNSTVLAQVLSFVKGIEQTKVVSKALDGSIYIQTIGTGVSHAGVKVLATRTEMDSVNQAEADGALVSVVYRGTNYLGYIKEAPEWNAELPGEWYSGTFELLIDEEVST